MITGFKQIEIMGYPVTVIMDDDVKPGVLRLLSRRDLINMADEIHERLALDLFGSDTCNDEGNDDGPKTRRTEYTRR